VTSRPTSRLRAGALLAAAGAAAACAHARHAPTGPLAPFASEEALAEYLRGLSPVPTTSADGGSADSGFPAAIPALAASARSASAKAGQGEGHRTGRAASLTNSQQADVDEGGIVKRHGDHLVILRRGRLFTVAVGGGALCPVDAVDAFGPGLPPADWYDEMLVSRDRVVVIGYSYQRGGTEFGVFDIDDAGRLRHRATYDLRSDDYYASRNYASRLVGTKLVFYTPLRLDRGLRSVREALPAMRRADGVTAAESPFEPIVAPDRIYRPLHPLPPAAEVALHTVTVCDLARADVRCAATSVVGPSERVYYVSASAVYVWTSGQPSGATFADGGSADGRPGSSGRPAASTLYRMPLDGSAPQALDVRGSPIDQFSFSEGEDGYLNVLVRAEAGGEGMWRAERAAGDVALLRVPVASFKSGEAGAASYRPLPAAADGVAHDRFIGQYLLYGGGQGADAGSDDAFDGVERGGPGARVTVVPVAGGAVTTVAVPHEVERIEGMGAAAVVVGASPDGRDLHFTGIRLGEGRPPAPAQHFVLRGAAQGEERSHGFFYREDGDDAGVIGLPVRGVGGGDGWASLTETSAAVEYVRNAHGRFTDLGRLASADAPPTRGGGGTWSAWTGGAGGDGCVVSCEDWYGNSRPLFLGRRTLALMGYELVEGEVQGGRMREVRRVRFAPGVVAVRR
jgi:hypothetical protein